MKAVFSEMPVRWQRERANADVAQWDEMWDGVLHLPPMPSGFHQDVELGLASYLRYNWARPRGCLVRHQVNLTTPDDEDAWTKNYRIPDLVLLTPGLFAIDKDEYIAGAPLVVVEIRSPGDETDEKLVFYLGLGVPEVWVIDSDTCRPELSVLDGGAYRRLMPDADGWVRSPATGVEFRPVSAKQLGVRLAGRPGTEEMIP